MNSEERLFVKGSAGGSFRPRGLLAVGVGLVLCGLLPSPSRASLIWESNVGSALPLSGFLANGVSGAPTPFNGLQIVNLDAQHAFPFLGTTYDSLSIGTSGFIWLNAQQPNTAQCCLLSNAPSALLAFEQGSARIAPGWAALRPDVGGSIDFNQISDANGNRTVITYDNVAADADANHNVTFQVQLFTSGKIIFSYQDFDGNSLGSNAATVLGLTPGGDFSPQIVDFLSVLAGNSLVTNSASLYDFLTVTNGLNLSGNSIVFTPQTVSGVGSSGTSGWLVSAAAAVPEPSSLIPVAATLFLLTLIYQRRTRITKYKV